MAIRHLSKGTLFETHFYIAPYLSEFLGPLFLGHPVHVTKHEFLPKVNNRPCGSICMEVR